jgi:4-hydroxybenzoate polyprenyltransferase
LSTPDGGSQTGKRIPRPAARLLGIVRLGHPFPSTLDAVVTGAIAALAGADALRAMHLAVAMLAIQVAIGAANDWADAPTDATSRPGKPIPAGLVSRRGAARVAAAAAATGLTLATLIGPLPLAVAALGLATGLAYDLRLKGTRWSWLPYAVGIPLLPVYAWVGTTGTLPPAIAVMVALAALAGAALAVANALADLERDVSAGTETVATALGIERARRVGAALQAVAVGGAVASAVVLGGGPAGIALVAVGALLVAVGVAAGLRPSTTARQRAWELQGIGVGFVAAGWIAAVAAGDMLG